MTPIRNHQTRSDIEVDTIRRVTLDADKSTGNRFVCALSSDGEAPAMQSPARTLLGHTPNIRELASQRLAEASISWFPMDRRSGLRSERRRAPNANRVGAIEQYVGAVAEQIHTGNASAVFSFGAWAGVSLGMPVEVRAGVYIGVCSEIRYLLSPPQVLPAGTTSCRVGLSARHT